MITESRPLTAARRPRDGRLFGALIAVLILLLPTAPSPAAAQYAPARGGGWDTRRPFTLIGKANAGREAKGTCTCWEPGVRLMACGER